MYESKNEAVISAEQFRSRLLLHALGASALLVLSIVLGVAGHLYFEDGVKWYDAAFNATLARIEKRCQAFLALSLGTISRDALKTELERIATL